MQEWRAEVDRDRKVRQDNQAGGDGDGDGGGDGDGDGDGGGDKEEEVGMELASEGEIGSDGEGEGDGGVSADASAAEREREVAQLGIEIDDLLEGRAQLGSEVQLYMHTYHTYIYAYELFLDTEQRRCSLTT